MADGRTRTRKAGLMALALWGAVAWGSLAPEQAFAVTDEQIANLQIDSPSEPGTKSAGAEAPGLAWVVGRTLLSLGAVFALMGGAAWLARKYMPQARQGRRGGIEVLSTRSIGSRRSLMIVRARGKTILLGVTPQSIQNLSEFEEEAAEWESEWRAGLASAPASAAAPATTGLEGF